MIDLKRREFLSATAGMLGLSGILGSLRPLSGDDLKVDGIERFSSEIEPLVQFLEVTPRDVIIEKVARRAQSGLSYRELLAALFLAGIRNVQPRPSVGFKFHAVLVVNSAHLASVSGPPEDRWLPIFWAIDNFKSSQKRDVREGNWTMSPVDESRVPSAGQAEKSLRNALETWDEEAADVAITAMVRHFGMDRVFVTLANYAARDFRSIGHKVIYLSNARRTLDSIGWEYAEPVMRSVVYAILNSEGESNPSTSDHSADRPGKINRELVQQLPGRWRGGLDDDQSTRDLIQVLHDCSANEASESIVEMIKKGISLRSIWDGLFGAAGELLMRKPGIVALHSVTTTNALHYAFRTCSDDATRQFLLLQNASFIPMFRETARGRGKLADHRIDKLLHEPTDNAESIPQIFETMGNDRDAAAQQMYSYLANGGQPQSVVDHARRLVFLKGSDSHDYKFSSAALEDYRVLSPAWRNRFLAASCYQLRSQTERTRPLVTRIREAIG